MEGKRPAGKMPASINFASDLSSPAAERIARRLGIAAKVILTFGVRYDDSSQTCVALTRAATGRPVGLVSWSGDSREVHSGGVNAGILLPNSLIAAGRAALRGRRLLVAQHPQDMLHWASALAAAGEREAVVVGLIDEQPIKTLAALIWRHVPAETTILPLGMWWPTDNLSAAA